MIKHTLHNLKDSTYTINVELELNKNNTSRFSCVFELFPFKLTPFEFKQATYQDKIYNLDLFELFVLFENNEYLEFNFCLDGQCGVYHFNNYRELLGDRMDVLSTCSFKHQSLTGVYEICGNLDVMQNKKMKGYQVSSIIEGRYFMANKNPNKEEKIDFHKLELFIQL